uniref:Uncharacterized protein n=2 Tax=unclassified bacterial viruses TaxID=12333 RepID=A0AAU6VYT6_9VIRU
MATLPETIAALERELALAKEQHAKEVVRNRPQAAASLAAIKVEIDGLIRQAEAIASSADIVFYYSNGYEEFSWQNKEDWSYSSQDC